MKKTVQIYIKRYCNKPYLNKLIFDPHYLHVTCYVLLAFELFLNVFIIETVKYTEIDWRAYMQEVEGFLNGTWDYKELKGCASSQSDYVDNPEETGPFWEGDILLVKETEGLRSSIFDYRWEQGIIPYKIGSYYPSHELAMIHKAINIIKRYTCVRFRPKTLYDKDYVNIVSTIGCHSHLGKVGGQQTVGLQSGKCFRQIGNVLHELMHSIGFGHEQSRNDRDSYVWIMWNNIRRGKNINFKKNWRYDASALGVPYDYYSVLHYANRAFSKNKRDPTIIPKVTGVSIGQRNFFSKGDIEKINTMYSCPNYYRF